MSNEDETFRRLRRVEFRQLEQRIKAATAAIEADEERRSVYLDTLKANGWTQEEYVVTVANTLYRIFTPKPKT